MRFTTKTWTTIPMIFVGSLCICTPASAQSDIVFAPGTGSGEPVQAGPIPRPSPILYTPLSCAEFASARERIDALYPPHDAPVIASELAESANAALTPTPTPMLPSRLDKTLLDTALDSYHRNICTKGQDRGTGPSQIVIVDYAKPSSQPRLYAVNLLSGQGLDTPVAVAHGIGSDRNDDGIAESFSNVYNSLASSLGAARGGELYTGINGLSLRLDGLDPSNSGMRVRDIVAHSYPPERRRYFNASLVQVRGGKPGLSEGCFVVAPHLRDWLFGILRDGGFLFAGLGGDRAKEMPKPVIPGEAIVGEVVFVPGTGG